MEYRKNTVHRKLSFRVTVVGDSSVGKSTLLSLLAKEEHLPLGETVGVHFKEVRMFLEPNLYLLYTWEIGGHPRHADVANMYYKSSDIILIVANAGIPFSFYSVQSFLDAISYSLQEVKEEVSSPPLVGVLIIEGDYDFRESTALRRPMKYPVSTNFNDISYWTVNSVEDVDPCFKDIVRKKISMDCEHYKKHTSHGKTPHCSLCAIL